MSDSKTATTALHRAAHKGDVRRVGVLVEKRKEDLWTKTEHGWLPIHVAARHGGPDVVRFFIEYANNHPKDGDMINAQDNWGATPLHLAAVKGDAASLEVLVGEGRADPWIKAENGWLPIHEAAWCGQPEAVRFFLKYNASHPERGDMLNERDNYGRTPLPHAVQMGHVECVRLLLEAGADVTIANEKGNTPVDLADEGSDILSLLTRKLSLLTRKKAMDDKYDFLHHKVLGEGAFGLVTVAVHKLTGERFAKKNTKLIREHEKLEREIEVMEKLRHPNIVELLEHSSVEEEGGTSITLIMELCDQSLHNWLKTHPFEKRCRQNVTSMLVGLSEGLAFIHEQKIIHRDLHTANVLMKLVNGKEIIKITDFGLSIAVNTGYTLHTDRVGWQLCQPPEVRVDDERRRLRYDYKVDVYAEGLIFYELLANFEFNERVKRLQSAI
ncbi:unnamed protein product, partial [Cyprideis torosa]